jgi:hypothetical protein
MSAGCGLVGIVAAKRGANVTLTDIDTSLLQAQLDHNNVIGSVSEWSWGRFSAPLVADPGIKVVVASDVFYDARMVERVLVSLWDAIQSGYRVLVAYHDRGGTSIGWLMRRYGMRAEWIPLPYGSDLDGWWRDRMGDTPVVAGIDSVQLYEFTML